MKEEFLPLPTYRKPVSILLTAYKTHEFIEDCLDSIENQTYFQNNDRFEVLLGIDACGDTLRKVEEIHHKYRNLRVFMLEENRGTYVTTNTLLDKIQYDNIIRFDTDDIMLPHMVNELLHFSDEKDFIRFTFFNFLKNLDNVYTTGDWAAAGAVFYKRWVIEKAGGYIDWPVSGDVELIKRLENTNVRFFTLLKKLFYRRIHAGALTVRNDTQNGSKIRTECNNKIKAYKPGRNVNIDRVTGKHREIDFTKRSHSFLCNTDSSLGKIGLLVVNYNNLNYTKDCVNDIFNQINKNFDLYVVDQNSSESGTQEFLNDIESRGANVIRNDSNVDLNRVWDSFSETCSNEYLCFLNNDLRLPNNFVDDTINVFKREPSAGLIVHVTNKLEHSFVDHSLKYEFLNPPLNQGWDFSLRRSLYEKIPDSLRIFGGEDFLFSKIIDRGFNVVLVYSSPVIHFKEKTRDMLGDSIKEIHKSDINSFHLEKFNQKLEIINPTYPTKCNKYAPDGMMLKQNKKCIFTGLTGNYDDLTTSAKEKQRDWDYLCFTDSNINSNFWKVINIENSDKTQMGNHKLARKIKTNFFDYLSSYDIILWKDSRIIINCDLNDYLKLLGNNDIVFMKHPDSNSILEEFDSVVSLGLERQSMVDRIKKRYEENGYKYDNGLIASGIMLFKNNERTISFFKTWWEEIRQFSHRDQLSANYALSKHPELVYETIPQNNIISSVGYFLRGTRKSERFKA